MRHINCSVVGIAVQNSKGRLIKEIMKKNSILIAAFAVIVAASAAKAQVDFDGKFGAQSMHSIFSAGHNIIPTSVSQGIIQPENPTMQAVAEEAKVARVMSYKVLQLQIEVLKNINTNLIKNEKLGALLETPGTEIWFQGNIVTVINVDMKGRFIIRDRNVSQAVCAAQSGDQRFDPVDLVVIGIVEVAHIISNGIQEYGSWPPVPDNGTANDYHGPALTVDQNDSNLQSYPSRTAVK